MDRLVPVITTARLLRKLKSGKKNVRMLDASIDTPGCGRDARRHFERLHIPGASFFSLEECSDSHSPYSYMLPSERTFSDYVSEKGIDNDCHVIIYDRDNSYVSAARVWWMFRVFGHTSVSVLDGGLTKWVKEGLQTSDLNVSETKRVFESRFQPQLYKTFEQMVGNVGHQWFQVLDVRSRNDFHGDNTHYTRDFTGLHAIPGSHNIIYTDFIRRSGLELKSPSSILRILQEEGIDLSLPLTTTCMRGIKACSAALALAVLGKSDVAVYDGSWQEFKDRVNESLMEEVIAH